MTTNTTAMTAFNLASQILAAAEIDPAVLNELLDVVEAPQATGRCASELVELARLVETNHDIRAAYLAERLALPLQCPHCHESAVYDEWTGDSGLAEEEDETLYECAECCELVEPEEALRLIDGLFWVFPTYYYDRKPSCGEWPFRLGLTRRGIARLREPALHEAVREALIALLALRNARGREARMAQHALRNAVGAIQSHICEKAIANRLEWFASVIYHPNEITDAVVLGAIETLRGK
jgi:hypothetical protein